MNAEEVDYRVRSLIQKILDVKADEIRGDSHLMNDLGADSWQYLEFRTELEMIFRILIPDEEVDRLGTVGECTNLVLEHLQRDSFGENGTPPLCSSVRREAWCSGNAHLDDQGTYFVDLEVGMPLLGRCNLAETPLLRLLGDIRWNHITRFTGVPSKRLTDGNGDRLYATFYYTDIRFPRQTPMASFGENDRVTVVNTLQAYGNSIVDGITFFYPASLPLEKKVPLKSMEQALEEGVPCIRSSNIFVKMLQGAEWLKKSRPAQAGMDNIPKVAEVPETYIHIKRAGEQGRFRDPPDTFSRLSPQTLRVEYQIEPDRDLNGVGLLYYANYSMILDIAERRLLPEGLRVPISHDLLDLRTVVSRQSAYLSNAHQSDSIEVFLDVWMENPFLSNHPAPELSPVRLFLNYEMFRRSDGRKMVVSTAEKVLFGKTVEEAGLLDLLKNLSG